MSDGRYVVVALARARQAWCAEVARWSTSGAAPIELLTCMSADEALAVIGSGRRISALIADAGASRVDRELIQAAARGGSSTFVVTDGRVQRDWDALGAAAVIRAGFGLEQLLDLLGRHAELVLDDVRVPSQARIDVPPTERATTIAVMGTGGVGTSTVAMCVAQALAGRHTARTDGHRVALVDGARRGDLAMYHDVGDVIPGLPELVDAHRVDTVDPDEVRALLFQMSERCYDVLLGLRRPRDWVTLRPRSVEAALDGLRAAYPTVVLDVDSDLDGEDDTGSVDVEDRHSISRCAVTTADLVVVVGVPGIKGLHGLLRLTGELTLAGVPPERILSVSNRATRNPAGRASAAVSHARLSPVDGGGPALLQLPTTRRLEHSHRQVARLPESLCRPLGRAVRQILLDAGPRATAEHTVTSVEPGELGVHRSDPATGRSEVA